MSALDRLSGYSASKSKASSGVSAENIFDLKTPKGAFLDRVHSTGYKLYNFVYKNTDTVISEEDYFNLPLESRVGYERDIEYTELYNVLTTTGNQEINAIAGSGKALRNGTKVYSSFGYTEIQDLKIGDKVLGSDGKEHTVTGVFPQGLCDDYELIFSDGTVIIANADHIWSVLYLVPANSSGEHLECTTKDLLEGSLYKDVYIKPMSRVIYPKGDITDVVYITDVANSCFNYVRGVASDSDLNLINTFIYDNTGYSFYSDITNSVVIPHDLIADLLFSILTTKCNNTCRKVFLKSFRGIGDYFDTSSFISPCYVKFFVKLLKVFGHFVEEVDKNLYKYTNKIKIKSIRKLDSKSEMTCISVDAKDHLYITEGYIPTHNTTSLIFKIMYDIVTGDAMRMQQLPNGNLIPVVDNMWVCTFLRSGAKELSDALYRQQKKMGYNQTANQITFSTLDAEFKRCLNAMGVATNIGNPSKLDSLLKKAIDTAMVKKADGGDLVKEDYKIISSIITYMRGRLDTKRYSHPSCADYNLMPSTLDLIVSMFAKMRESEGIMDFDEIQELLYKYLYTTPNKAVQDFVASRYNYIYIDEFQDTSQMQYAILKFYARGSLWINKSTEAPDDDNKNKILFTGYETKGKIVAIGDPSQCIYSFKGSDSRILVEHFDNDFRPTLCTLSYNYRCPSNILNPIVPSIHKNIDSASQKIVAFNEGGEFKVIGCPSYSSMVNTLLDNVEKDVINGMNVAILCRTNFDGMIPAFISESERRFEFSISGEGMTMDSPLPKKLMQLPSLFMEKSTTAVKNSLQLLVPRYHQWQVNSIMDVLKLNSLSIWDLPLEDLSFSCTALYDVVKVIKPLFYEGGSRIRSRELEALQALYFHLRVNVFKGDSAYQQNARAYIETLQFLLETKHFNSVYDFVEELDILNSRLSARVSKTNVSVNIITVHESKGKEYDSVYIWNDSEDVFPSAKCSIEDEEQLAEERRVHYIACTRAKKKSTILTMNGSVGMFVKEMDCKIEPVQSLKVKLT